MQATIHSNKFDWTAAIHDEVVKSLCSSFGLDFLLFEDKVGGDVDTIHNVRQGIYATDLEKKRFEERGDYKSIITDAEGNAVLDKNGKVIKENKYQRPLHETAPLLEAYHQTEKKQRMAMK